MEWKPVPTFSFLEASSTGLLRTVDHDAVTVQAHRTFVQKRKGRILKQMTAASGHKNVTLPAPEGSKNRQRAYGVHRLVCLAFHGLPPEGKPWALHKDDDPSHNDESNLYWGSPADNGHDAYKNGSHAKGEGHHNTTLTEQQVVEIRARYKAKTKAHGSFALAKEYGVHRTTIENIVRNKTWN